MWTSEMFQNVVWLAAVNLFGAFILFDQWISGEYHNVVTNNFNGSSYDFIIGENSQTYLPRECWGWQILADQLYYFDFVRNI